MRKAFVLGAVVAALVVPTVAISATLHNGQGVGGTCPRGQIGVFHFVNNQDGGTQSAGTIWVTFAHSTFSGLAQKINPTVQMWWVESNDVLVDATTNLPGKLVLSDFSCVHAKKK
jgi:hypothetical protein